MDKTTISSASTDALHLRTEAVAKAKANAAARKPEDFTPEKYLQTLHELEVRQIQLEMQNDELNQARDRLEESRDRYFDLYDMAPVGYLTLDKNGVILEANLTTAKLLDIERAALIHQSLTHFIFSDDQDIYYRHKKQLFEKGRTRSCELRMLRKDGSAIWVRILSEAAKGADGDVSRTVLSDISDRKQVEDFLSLSDARYASIVEDQTDLICRYFPDGKVSFVNQAYAKYFGKRRKEILNHNFIPNIPEPDISMIVRRIKDITYIAPSVDFEHRVIMPDGSVRWQYWIHHGIFSDENTLVEYQGVGRDVTEHKRLEDELRKAKDEAENANKAKSQFLSNMSHELRTPLSPIIGFSELLAEAPNLTQEQRGWLLILRQRGLDLLALIGDILSLSKIEAGEITLDPQPFSIRRLINDMVASIRPAAVKKGLSLDSQVAAELADSISLDGLRLRQIILNLLNNAIKFTPSGSIDLNIGRASPGQLSRQPNDGEAAFLFSVRDTGIGIPLDKHSQIFNAFHQADVSHARLYGGAGLGLAIAWSLTELMGGKIWVESKPGFGSTFFFTVIARVVQPITEESKTNAGTAASNAHNSLRILVVDDDEPCRMILAHFLRLRYGDSIRMVNDGQAALSLLDSETFDIVIMDGRMPKMDGVTTTKMIRQREAGSGRHMIIIAVTAHALENDEDNFLSAGMDGYLSKPVQKTTLYIAIDKALRKPEDANISNHLSQRH